jgi:acetyl-CoA C-acetyltransferase
MWPLGVAPGVEDVILGNCLGDPRAGAQDNPEVNLAQVAIAAAGLGDSVPGGTINRQRCSGLAAIVQASQAIRSNDVRLVLAGGTESVSTASLLSPDVDDVGSHGMGSAAETLVTLRGVTRERQDAYVMASHIKALAAREAGRFEAEIVPINDVEHDDHPRRQSIAALARLPATFGPDGSVTAGNTCPSSDGAAAVAMVPDQLRRGRPGLRLIAGALVGSDPRLSGWGSVQAIHRVLTLAGTRVRDVAAIEIVEAFAGQVLALTDALGLDPLGRDSSVVCADGGALALGHPWGAAGAIVVVRLFSRLVRADAPAGTRGLAAVAGDRTSVAALFEVVR